MTLGSICHKSLPGGMAGEVMCGDGRLLAAYGAHGWCIWCGLCPKSAGWRCRSWWISWVL